MQAKIPNRRVRLGIFYGSFRDAPLCRLINKIVRPYADHDDHHPLLRAQQAINNAKTLPSELDFKQSRKRGAGDIPEWLPVAASVFGSGFCRTFSIALTAICR